MEKVNKPCFNFNKGACHFGSSCKFLHNGVHGLASRTSSLNPITCSLLTNVDVQTLQNLMDKLGLNGNKTMAPNVGYTNVSNPRPVVLHTTSTVANNSPGYYFSHGPPGFTDPTT